MQFSRSKLSAFKQPKAIEIWDELPKSAANKILRRAIRDQLISKSAESSART
jgi:acyl-coenzyme A synthetase/AMP-(fatty) acid ligase